MKYEEHVPHSSLQDYVKCFWLLEREYTSEAPLRGPDGRFHRKAGARNQESHDETVRDGVNVPHLTIRKDIATKAFHELMNFDGGPSAFLLDHVKGFHVRIKLFPLTDPVDPDLFFPDSTPTFRCHS